MTSQTLPSIRFITVANNQSKLEQLCSVVYRHFLNNEKIAIAVPSQEAAVYIDQLLWRMPEESFLPHVIANHTSKERIVITSSLSNINQAAVMINLLTVVHPNPVPAQYIYELLDLTSSEKEALTRKKEAEYKAAGYLVTSN